MKQLAKKLVTLERDISRGKGDFSFFALFLREESPGKWDLVASAPWLDADEKETLNYFTKELRSRLDVQELLALSRIVFINEDDPRLERIQRDIDAEYGSVEHSITEVKDEEFFDMDMKRAYIITSKKGNRQTDAQAS